MISDERLLDFCRALSAAVRSGLALSDAFETLAKSPAHGRLISKAADMTARGVTIHEALKAQGIFPPVFIALMRAGEEGGKTGEFLDLYAGCLDVRIEFRRRIKRALVYPAFVALLGAALFLAVSFKAIPMLLGPITGAGAAVPEPALWVAHLAKYVQGNWPLVLGAVILALLAIRTFARSGTGRKTWSLAGHWLPVFRYATIEARLYNIYTTMSLLLKAGLPPSAMMDVLLQFAEDDPVTRRRFVRASEMLAGGVTFAASLDGFIPPSDLVGMEIAEKTGRLEETLLRLGKTHYDLHLHRLKVLTTGFTIATTAALAPLCFFLILSFIKPVLTAITGGGAQLLPVYNSSLPASSAPEAAPPADSSRAPRQTAPFDVVEDSATALFNITQGAKIADFINKHAVKPARKTKDAERPAGKEQPRKKANENSAKPETPVQLESSAPVKKIGPVPQIKKIQFKSTGSTSIQPSAVIPNPADQTNTH